MAVIESDAKLAELIEDAEDGIPVCVWANESDALRDIAASWPEGSAERKECEERIEALSGGEKMELEPGKWYLWTHRRTLNSHISLCSAKAIHGHVAMGGYFAICECGVFKESDVEIVAELPTPGGSETEREFLARISADKA